MQNRKSRLLLAVLGIVLLAAIVAWTGAWSGVAEQGTRVLEVVRRSGAPVFFVAMIVLPLVGFPLSVFIFSAGPLFAPTMGLPAVMAACLGAVLLNISVAYGAAAWLLRPTMERFVRWLGYDWPKTERVKTWEFALVMRLVPGMPFFVQSYVLGMAGVKFRVYIVISMLVSVGQVVAGVLVGDGLLRRDPGQLAIAGGVFAVLGLGMHLLRKRLAKKRKLREGEAQKNNLECPPENASHLAASVEATTSSSIEGGDHSSFRIHFGPQAARDGLVALPIPVLAGQADECIFPAAREVPSFEGFRLFASGDLLIGCADERVAADIEAKAYALYQRLLKIVGDRQLVRIWNYVPEINALSPDGLENYRAFCRGRSHAFEHAIGAQFRTHLPAASAVGGVRDRLAVIFVATRAMPQHIENPDQVPAYEYPEDHGPRPPSFARATRVTDNGMEQIFFSGTAAIKGHETMAVGDLAGQIECMLDNLQVLSKSIGLDAPLGLSDEWTRHCKVYLRHAADLSAAQHLLAGKLYRAGDQVTWLHADICRSNLLIEAELTLTRAAS